MSQSILIPPLPPTTASREAGVTFLAKDAKAFLKINRGSGEQILDEFGCKHRGEAHESVPFKITSNVTKLLAPGEAAMEVPTKPSRQRPRRCFGNNRRHSRAIPSKLWRL
jgi:hypothetical protein